jgi:hypothetical protein
MSYMTPIFKAQKPVDVFLDRLADIEARRLRDRMVSKGMSPTVADKFEDRVSAVLVQAKSREPQFMRGDIAELADKISRTAISASKRDDLRKDVAHSMNASAGLIRDRARPIVVESPFSPEPAPAQEIEERAMAASL